VFVNLFEGTEVEAAIRGALASEEATTGRDVSDGRDFRAEVEIWLERVLH
jgi:hypothetical protein